MEDYRPGYLHGPMRAWAERMRAQFEQIQRKHSGERGRRREDDVREFLRAFLPQRLAVGTGEIAATDGSVSPQMDLIVYDALETPLLERSESSVVVPIEGVYAVIEVSSKLTAAKLAKDAEKIRAVKAMPKRAYFERTGIITKYRFYGREWDSFPVHGFAFAYESLTTQKLVEKLSLIDDHDEISNNVDMICSLSRGCVANGVPAKSPSGERILTDWSGSPTPATIRFNIPVDPQGDARGDGLMLFYILAFSEIVQSRTEPLRMVPYMEIR
jgi:hypothetical protein